MRLILSRPQELRIGTHVLFERVCALALFPFQWIRVKAVTKWSEAVASDEASLMISGNVVAVSSEE
jgi:hypothetical protein